MTLWIQSPDIGMCDEEPLEGMQTPKRIKKKTFWDQVRGWFRCLRPKITSGK